MTLPAVDILDLDVTGMTCASCAARIERKLNKLEGVTASVNYATEKARVDVGATGLSADDVIATIEAVGYGARVHTTSETADVDNLHRLRRRLIVAVALGVPVLAALDDPRPAVRRLAVGRARRWRRRSRRGRPGRSTGRWCSTCVTARRRWTR